KEVLCHGIFALGVGSMVLAMGFGMSRSIGPFEGAAAWIANAVLLLQFPLGHSLLLTAPGRRLLTRLAPRDVAQDLLPTTYATVAALQVFLLFALWSPSGVVWWQAAGWTLALCLAAYGLSWLLLMKAMLDAGLELQSGLLGWWAVIRGRRPSYPDMPQTGLFRLTRQPIYVTFAMTLWTVPVWTPDQLSVALTLTAYCLIGPMFKERRFARLYGERFAEYRRRVPYWLPLPKHWR
ncbi:MAG: isoprenylcysteine carboxylmethyltransferase family protein, partial [Pseudomonadota bacterium]